MNLQQDRIAGAEYRAPQDNGQTGRRTRNGVKTVSARLFAGLLLSATAGCYSVNLNGDGTNPSPDGTFTSPECQSSATPIPRANEGNWTLVVLNDVIPGDEQFTCGNGEPYKFFVQFNTGATDLTVALEPGGACWDYETCEHQAGVLNPVRLEAVPDDLMTNLNYKPWAAMYPHFGRIDNSVPTNKYNHVFFPYCTGDAFTGDTEKTYYPSGAGEPVEVRHHGRRNLEAAAQWLAQTFPSGYVGQLLVIGSSAGAVGATANYPLIRDTISPQCGAMINDSGPIFPPKGGQFGGLYPPYIPSQQQGLLDRVSASWDLMAPGAIVEQLDNRFGNNWYRLLRDNIGHINRGLARAYPDDRFLFTTFKQDLNFSVFSFVGGGAIAPGSDIAEQVLDMWQSEVADFKAWIKSDSKENWGYYLPNFRPDFCSHMVATSPLTLVHDRNGYARAGIAGHADGYYRTEIGSMNLGDAIRQLLDRDQDIPRVDADPDPTQLSFTSETGEGVANDDWYGLYSGELIPDKQAYIDAELEDCVFTNGYPN